MYSLNATVKRLLNVNVTLVHKKNWPVWLHSKPHVPPEAETLAGYWHILRHQGPFNNVVTLLVCHYTIYTRIEPTTCQISQSDQLVTAVIPRDQHCLVIQHIWVSVCQHFEIFLEFTVLQIKIVMILQIPFIRTRTIFCCIWFFRDEKKCFWCYNISSLNQITSTKEEV